MSPISTSSKPVVAQPPPHWILLIVDYFTKAAEFVAVPSKSSALNAHALNVLHMQGQRPFKWMARPTRRSSLDSWHRTSNSKA